MQAGNSKNLEQNMHNCMKPLSQALSSKDYSNCAVCHGLLQVPIMLVENLGNVCESCMKNCAGCKAIRNTVLEFIIKKLPFQCKHRTQGCKKELLYNKLKEHEKVCEFGSMMRCLYPICGWHGWVKLYLNHFESCHKANVIKASNGEFCIDLKIGHPDGVYCLKRNNNHSFLKIFEKVITDFQIGVCFRIYADNVFPYSNYTLTFTGEDNTKFVLTCQSSPLDCWRDNSSNVAEKIITRSVLTALSGQMSSLQLDIKIEASEDKSESVVHKRVKQCLECPVCVNIMRPPIYQCSTGHSLCKECKAKVTECPSCKSFPINTRNYALEVLTNEIFYECNICVEMVLGKLLEEHEKSCKKKKKNRNMEKK